MSGRLKGRCLYTSRTTANRDMAKFRNCGAFGHVEKQIAVRADRMAQTGKKKLSFGAASSDDRPAARKHEFEKLLCEAIKIRVYVELRYDGETKTRTFAPAAVYHSTNDKVNVSGKQVVSLGTFTPSNAGEPRIFEVGLISAMSLTTANFSPDPRFDRADARYENGIICSV